jgi:hypothetical protein
MDDFSMRREDVLGMGEARLARLEAGARNGYSSPEQMLKLIDEVRRRRREMNAIRETIIGLSVIAGIPVDENGRWQPPATGEELKNV